MGCSRMLPSVEREMFNIFAALLRGDFPRGLLGAMMAAAAVGHHVGEEEGVGGIVESFFVHGISGASAAKVGFQPVAATRAGMGEGATAFPASTIDIFPGMTPGDRPGGRIAVGKPGAAHQDVPAPFSARGIDGGLHVQFIASRRKRLLNEL